MTRKLQPVGVCACCGAVGPVMTNVAKVLFAGTPGVGPWEPDLTLPDLCDACEYAQRRWDAAQGGGWYPFLEPPPKTPPVRRA